MYYCFKNLFLLDGGIYGRNYYERYNLKIPVFSITFGSAYEYELNRIAEFTNGKIIISNPEFDENSMQLEEELQSQSKSKSALEQESETKKRLLKI